LFATIAGVGDSIAAALLDYVEIADTAAMLTNYPSTVGYGILKSSKTIRADTTSPSGLATRLFAKTLPTTIAANYLATSNGTNLVARNLFDNNTYVGILNSKPFQFGQWTTTGRPTGTTGYTGFNTTLGYQEFYDGSTWFPTGFWSKSGTAINYAAGRIGINSSAPTEEVEMIKTINGSVNYSATNLSTGSGAASGFVAKNSSGALGSMFKIGTGYSTYKTLTANSFGVYNNTSGNISFLNDWIGGNILFAAGASSTAQLTIESDGDLFSTGKIGVGITPVDQIDIEKTINGGANISIKNLSTGSSAIAGLVAKNSSGSLGSIFKTGTGYTTYKNISANDFGTYTNSGNLSFLNDNVGGNFNIATGGSATPQLTLASTGRLLLGTTTDVTGYQLNIAGTGAMSLPRGTVAQRPTIAANTTPFRYNTDSTALEYGESVGTWRQLATRAYARSLVASAANIYNSDGQTNSATRYLKTSGASSHDIFIGYFGQSSTDFNPNTTRKNLRGLYVSPAYQEGVGIISMDSSSRSYSNIYESPYFLSLLSGNNGAGKYNAIDIGQNGGTSSSDRIRFRGVNNASVNYDYSFPTVSPGSGDKVMLWSTGTPSFVTTSSLVASAATVAFETFSRDTSTSNTDFTVTSTLLSTCQELFISAEVTGAATDTVNIILPLPSSAFANKKVYVFGDDDSSTWWVATKTLLGNGLYFSNLSVKPTAQNYAAVTTNTGISGSTYTWMCTRRNSGTWNWVLIQEN
jgi:hypothetical protein